jgi:poly(A) polymerase
MGVLRTLEQSGFSWHLELASALDRYHRHPRGPNVYVAVEAELVDLARTIDALSFPGLDRWDAVARDEDATVFFRCVESGWLRHRSPFEVFSISYDPRKHQYRDPHDAYEQLRGQRVAPSDGHDDAATAMDAAVLAARYGYEVDMPVRSARWRPGEVSEAEQQRLLIDVLTGRRAEKGLDLLDDLGFVGSYWSPLAQMGTTDHTKDFHPEGDVWEHTLEALSNRKSVDLTVSAALLLHDVGKPESPRTRERAFDGHAEIGARTARRFLRDLGFGENFVERVAWLVRHHMVPGVIHKLPARRVEPVMGSPLFPLLLEVYRCDLSATFTGPEPYYRACKTYRTFLKNRSNPFRDVDGKKLLKLYVE